MPASKMELRKLRTEIQKSKTMICVRRPTILRTTSQAERSVFGLRLKSSWKMKFQNVTVVCRPQKWKSENLGLKYKNQKLWFVYDVLLSYGQPARPRDQCLGCASKVHDKMKFQNVIVVCRPRKWNSENLGLKYKNQKLWFVFDVQLSYGQPARPRDQCLGCASKVHEKWNFKTSL